METISRCKDKIIFRQSKPASPAFNTHLIPRSPQFRPERPQETIWGKKSAFCTKVQNAESGAADLADAVGGTDHQLVAEIARAARYMKKRLTSGSAMAGRKPWVWKAKSAKSRTLRK